MPNHVVNRINLEGDKEKIAEMLNAIKSEDYGIGSIDFNKIIPMPESLNTTVKPCVNSVTNFLLCRGSVSLSVTIKHPITPSLVHHRRVFRVPRGRTPMSAYPLNNRWQV